MARAAEGAVRSGEPGEQEVDGELQRELECGLLARRRRRSVTVAETADLILPVSKMASGQNASSAFVVPGDEASSSHVVPPKTRRAIFSVAASGQAAEEFWYANVLESLRYTFNETTGELLGFSPFREIQLRIDGLLAGVVFPYPVIFTGGLAPGLWKPIVGIDTFDLREPEIDVSPFLPMLTDSKSHSFELSVHGLAR